MPTKPPRMCPSCRQPITGPTCRTCRPAWSTSSRPGSTRQSRKQRAAMLASSPLCATGCGRLAVEDDHVIPWSQRGDMSRAEWDAPANHQGLCSDCHRAKTRDEAAKGTT